MEFTIVRQRLQFATFSDTSILTSQCLLNFLVYDDSDLHTALSGGQKHLIKPVTLILGWGTSQVELRA